MPAPDRTSSTDPAARRSPPPPPPTPAPPPARRAAGFSVVEGLVASAVLAVAVVGVAGPMAASAQHARLARERGSAMVLARQLIEEIAARPLCNGAPTLRGPELPAENNRSKYDTVDDYHGYRDTTRELRNLDGQIVALPDTATPYVREVAVEYRTPPQFDPSANVTDYAVVTVTVTSPQKESVRVSRLFCKYTLAR